MEGCMTKLKQVIVVRKDLNMRKGKMIAQSCHASVNVVVKHLTHKDVKSWMDNGLHTKICVSVDSEQELLDVYNSAQNAGIISSLITDSGLTEFHGVPTKTCVAIGPADSDKIDLITGHLKLL